MEVSFKGLEHNLGDKPSVLSINNGHGGRPVLCAELSVLIDPDWLHCD